MMSGEIWHLSSTYCNTAVVFQHSIDRLGILGQQIIGIINGIIIEIINYWEINEKNFTHKPNFT